MRGMHQYRVPFPPYLKSKRPLACSFLGTATAGDATVTGKLWPVCGAHRSNAADPLARACAHTFPVWVRPLLVRATCCPVQEVA